LVEQFGAPRLASGDLAAAIGDLGLMGVLDKNIVIGAELFLSAAEGCGKLSSYTRQIVQARNLTSNTTNLRNVVQHFGPNMDS